MLKHSPMRVTVQFADHMYGGAIHTVEFSNVVSVENNDIDLIVTTADDNGMTANHAFTKKLALMVDIQMGQLQIEESRGGMF